MFSINIISVNFKYPFFFWKLLNAYLIATSKKFQIFKNGSDYQGASPPLFYSLQNIPVDVLDILYFNISIMTIIIYDLPLEATEFPRGLQSPACDPRQIEDSATARKHCINIFFSGGDVITVMEI